jgi:hypothetical protein
LRLRRGKKGLRTKVKTCWRNKGLETLVTGFGKVCTCRKRYTDLGTADPDLSSALHAFRARKEALGSCIEGLSKT